MAGIRSRRKAERPGEILEAAFAEFVLNGYAGTRLEDVAKRAGVTKGTIYFYFGSKEQVFEQAIQKVGSQPLAIFNEKPRVLDGDLSTDIYHFLNDLYGFIDAHPRARETLRLLVAEAQRFPKAADAYFAAFMDPVLDRLRIRLSQGIASGEIAGDAPFGAEAIASPPFAYMVMSLLFPDKRGVSSKGLLHAQMLLYGGLPATPWLNSAEASQVTPDGPSAGMPPGGDGMKPSTSSPTNLLAQSAKSRLQWLTRAPAWNGKAVEQNPPSARSSAVDIAVVRLRSLIRERSLVVGDVLPSEVELAAMFGASRNTIREAVRTLRAFGVVESRRKVGAVLIDNRRAAMSDLLATTLEISAETFRDIQGFRRLTEMNLGEKVVGRASEGCLKQMALANRAMRATDNPVEAARLDFRFHMLLVDEAGNRTLAEIYGMLEPVICRLMEVGKSQRSALHTAAAEHDAILRALEEGDRIGFTYHMDRHLDAGLQFIPASGSAATAFAR